MRTVNSEEEREVLHSLAWTWRQYISDLDNSCMGAGEMACELMRQYGLVIRAGSRFAEWTPLGKAFLEDENALPVS